MKQDNLNNNKKTGWQIKIMKETKNLEIGTEKKTRSKNFTSVAKIFLHSKNFMSVAKKNQLSNVTPQGHRSIVCSYCIVISFPLNLFYFILIHISLFPWENIISKTQKIKSICKILLNYLFKILLNYLLIE